jgi:hypothetical protein
MTIAQLFLNLSSYIDISSTNFSEHGVNLFEGIYYLHNLDFNETGLHLKQLIEKTYKSGITGLENVQVKAGNITGIFLDQVSPGVTQHFQFIITPKNINYERVSPGADELTYAEYSEWVDFVNAAKPRKLSNREAGGEAVTDKTGKTKYCTPNKTFACGNRCIAIGKECKDKLNPQQQQLQKDVIKANTNKPVGGKKLNNSNPKLQDRQTTDHKLVEKGLNSHEVKSSLTSANKADKKNQKTDKNNTVVNVHFATTIDSDMYPEAMKSKRSALAFLRSKTSNPIKVVDWEDLPEDGEPRYAYIVVHETVPVKLKKGQSPESAFENAKPQLKDYGAEYSYYSIAKPPKVTENETSGKRLKQQVQHGDKAVVDGEVEQPVEQPIERTSTTNSKTKKTPTGISKSSRTTELPQVDSQKPEKRLKKSHKKTEITSQDEQKQPKDNLVSNVDESKLVKDRAQYDTSQTLRIEKEPKERSPIGYDVKFTSHHDLIALGERFANSLTSALATDEFKNQVKNLQNQAIDIQTKTDGLKVVKYKIKSSKQKKLKIPEKSEQIATEMTSELARDRSTYEEHLSSTGVLKYFEELHNQILSRHGISKSQAEDAILRLKFGGSTLKEDKVLSRVQSDLMNVYRFTGGKGLGTLRSISADKNRGSANAGSGTIDTGIKAKPDTIWHEFGHHVEMSTPGLAEASRSWVDSRAISKRTKKLKDLTGINQFGDNEIAIQDQFLHPYVGRVYGDKGSPTEVISTGLQRFISPKAMVSFYLQDREHFMFTLGAILGNRGN